MTIAFPFTPVLDNFNRANGALGANWTNVIRPIGGTPALPEADAGCVVASNQMQPAKTVFTTSNYDSSAFWKTAFGSNNEAYVTLGANYSPPGYAPPPWDGYVTVWARGKGLGTATYSGYKVFWHPVNSQLWLEKCSNTQTNSQLIASAMAVPTLVAGDSIGIRVYGTTQEAWYKKAAGAWTLAGSAGDTAFVDGGLIGVSFYDSARFVDNFGGGVVPVEAFLGGTISPLGAPRRAITVAPGGRAGALAPAGLLTKRDSGAPKTGNVPLLGTLGLTTGTAPLITPQADFPVMEEEQVAVLPWPDGQRVLQQPGSEGLAIPASCGWHGSAFDPERGAFGIVASDGPLADLVGERLKVTRRDVSPARTVWVYVHADSETLTEELSLSRRAFMALGDLALDSVQVSVDTVSAAVIT